MNEHSITDLPLLQNLFQDVHYVFRPAQPGDVKHSLADISKARAIGYESQYSLDKGLRETIKRLPSAS